MEKKLTEKQKLFCLEYIKDFNATQAAIRAGYSKSTAYSIGSENLSKPEIQSYLSNVKAERIEKVKYDAQRVLERLIEIDSLDVVDILDEEGNAKPVHQWPDAWRRSISGVDLSSLKLSDDLETIVKKIKWPDKLRNLELIGKHVDVKAWEKDKVVEVTTSIMPVPCADSTEDWEKVAESQQSAVLKKDG